MNWQERIILDPQILVGKPVVKGTGLAVEFIIDLLARGWKESEVLRNYPGLTHEDIQACLGYASEMLRAEKVYPLELTENRLDYESAIETKATNKKWTSHEDLKKMLEM